MTDLAKGIVKDARSAADGLLDAADRAIRDARQYLASPQGRQLRNNVARGMIALTPALTATPLLRRSPIVKLLGVAGAATVIVKVAEMIRDWEPEGATPQPG